MYLAKNKKTIYLFLAILIMLIVGVILYIKMRSGGSLDYKALTQEANKEFKLDIGILQGDFFQGLARYGTYPIKPRFPGRKNPFEPY